MKTINQCKTAELITIYGNKKVRKYVANHKVRYTRQSYDIAAKLPSITEAMYHLESTEISLKETIRLAILYYKTCDRLIKQLKKDTKKAKVK